MYKSLAIYSFSELEELKNRVIESMNKASSQIATELTAKDSQTLFSKMKFGGVGYDPLNPERELNLIEQVNQSFTYLASFYALEVVFSSHSNLSPFRLNLGTTPGSDIESVCGQLAAEVFASVTPTNNQKLKKDIDKVSKTDAIFKYAFFMCPGFELGRQTKLESNGVLVWALKGANALSQGN